MPAACSMAHAAIIRYTIPCYKCAACSMVRYYLQYGLLDCSMLYIGGLQQPLATAWRLAALSSSGQTGNQDGIMQQLLAL